MISSSVAPSFRWSIATTWAVLLPSRAVPGTLACLAPLAALGVRGGEKRSHFRRTRAEPNGATLKPPMGEDAVQDSSTSGSIFSLGSVCDSRSDPNLRELLHALTRRILQRR